MARESTLALGRGIYCGRLVVGGVYVFIPRLYGWAVGRVLPGVDLLRKNRSALDEAIHQIRDLRFGGLAAFVCVNPKYGIR
jgi:hypothetical protein